MFAGFGVALCMGSAYGSSNYDEQGKLVRAPRAVGVLGPNLFGDQVNLYTGTLSFNQTDVSLPGNNALSVSVGRTMATGDFQQQNALFGNWDLAIPHLHGIFSGGGWKSSDGTGARCNRFGKPPGVSYQGGSWNPTEFWHGSFLTVPGAGTQELLRRTTNPNVPPGPETYPVVTTGLWAFSCLPTLANADPSNYYAFGEGFMAAAPDGTRYRFDWLVDRVVDPLEKGTAAPQFAAAVGGDSGEKNNSKSEPAIQGDVAKVQRKQAPVPTLYADGYILQRKEIWILPTVVTDRYGNTVTYKYNSLRPWQLQSITASDGRVITMTYVPNTDLVASVYDGTRTWTYTYSTVGGLTTLVTVRLPDNSMWQLQAAATLRQGIQYWDTPRCETPGSVFDNPISGAMTHPSGAIAEFTLTPTIHGREGVWRDCRAPATINEYSYYPNYFATAALTKKVLRGPGLGTLAWNTTYPAPVSNWFPCTTCTATKQVTVTDPAGNITRTTFGTLYNQNEGQLQTTTVSDASGNVLSSTGTQYQSSGPWPVAMGTSDQKRGDAELSSRLIPQNMRTTTQQGVDFSWTVNSFDTMARPVTVTRASTLGDSRTEATTYFDHNAKWILGQIASITGPAISGSNVMVGNTFDPSNANLLSTSYFGHVDETRAYNTDGTLASRADGNSKSTTFGSYKRGLAQSVAYPTGVSESALVNNIGSISSTTDQNGYTTSYDYDAMGRLKLVTYPGADTTAWNSTNLLFEQVASSEMGIATGHWKQTVSTGNARVVNYYDALWRPLLTRTFDAANPGATGSAVLRRFDFNGKTTFESYPQRDITDVNTSPVGTSTSYDSLGRGNSISAGSELGPLNTTISYISGFRKTVTNPRNFSTTTSFQAYDEPNEAAIRHIDAPEGVTVDIARDAYGKTTSINRSGLGKSLTRSYVYDANQRLCKTVEPETGATVQDYDGANNVVWRSSGNALTSLASCDTASVGAATKIAFGYDALNRLRTTTYSDGSPSIARTYTPDGLLETISSNGALWTNSFNKRRLNVLERLNYGGAVYDIARSYDANGSLSQLRYPVDNLTLNYAPNALGQPSQVGIYANSIAYHPNGAIASFNYGNGVAHSLTQNTRGLPNSANDTGVLSDFYSYDANSNVAGIEDRAQTVTNRSMAYDGLDRLASVSAPNLWGNAAYTYDTLDNLTSSTITGGATARTLTMNYPDPATNRLMSTTSGPAAFNFSYAYDSQGNIIQRGGQTYVFDQGNRMTSAAGKGTYAYDGLGHRVSVVGIDGLNLVQVYSQGGQMLYAGPTGNIGTKYIYMHNHVLAEVSGNGTQYDHTDGLGSPVARTDAARNVLSRTRYEPYGYTAAGTTPTAGFTGHVNDAETGLVYMQQRYYDPIASRFLSIDPVTTDANTGGSFNRYAYASNNPFKYVDPDGREDTLWSCSNASPPAVAYNTPPPDQGWHGEQARSLNFALTEVGAPGGTGLKLGAGAVGIVKSLLTNAGRLEDAALVCRGGLCSAESFKTASGVIFGLDGTVGGISTQSKNGAGLFELAQPFKNGAVGVTTAGDIRAAGGKIVADGTKRNPNHATISGLTPKQLEKLFTPTVPNPVPKIERGIP